MVPAFEVLTDTVFLHLESMRCRAEGDGGINIRWSGFGRAFADADVELFFGQAGEEAGGEAGVLCHDLGGGVRDPIRNTKRPKFREVAAIESQEEMTGFIAEALEHVAVAFGEVPDIALVEVVCRGGAVGGDDGGSHAAFEDIGPFRGDGVPVEFAEGAGVETHRDAGDALRDGEFFYCRFFGGAAFAGPAFGAVFDVVDKVFEFLLGCGGGGGCGLGGWACWGGLAAGGRGRLVVGGLSFVG